MNLHPPLLVRNHRRKSPKSSPSYILFYKPYGVLSQFTPEGGRKTLADYGPFPNDVYAAGRLDGDSEGLLLLTNDRRLIHRLTDPKFGHPRTYVALVERIPDEESLSRLRHGLAIAGKKTRPAEVRLLGHEPAIPLSPVVIRYRKNVPTAWLEIILREGRNRQVRKMTAAAGHPTLRLVRTAIGALTSAGLKPGEWRVLSRREIEAITPKTRMISIDNSRS